MPTQILNKLPTKAKELYDATYKAAVKTHSDVRAGKIALLRVLKQFNPVGESWVAKFEGSPQYSKVVYQFQATEDSISKSIDGMIYRDYILSSDRVDSENQAFSDFALKRMTEQINEEKLIGRVEEGKHPLWDKLSKEGLTPAEIEERLQSLDTGIEAVSARYDNGKLVAKVKFTPEAYEHAKDVNGASIEARFPTGSLRAGVFHQARLQGFILTNNPANPDAVAIS